MIKVGLFKLALIFALGAPASAAAARLDFKLLNGLNYYEVLGVSREAKDAEIKRAYRAAMMKHHPDRGGQRAMAQFVNEAYEILENGYKRQAFDLWLNGGATDRARNTHREPPPKTEAERRSEILQKIVNEVSTMAQAELQKNPRTTKAQMADLARGIIIYYSRFLPGAQIKVTDLEFLLSQFALAHSAGFARGYSEMLALAVGTIEILRGRARYPHLEDGRQANEVLRSLESRLAFDIENHHDSRKRMHFDTVYEFLTGQSILRRRAVSSCEAALRYRTADGLTVVIPNKIDIRF
jgi:hypothetical protein